MYFQSPYRYHIQAVSCIAWSRDGHMTSRIIWCPGAVTIMISRRGWYPDISLRTISRWSRKKFCLLTLLFSQNNMVLFRGSWIFLSWNALRACLVYYVYIKHTIFYFALNNQIYGMTHLGMVKFSQFSTKFKSSLIQVLTIARLSTMKLKLSKLGKVKQDSF